MSVGSSRSMSGVRTGMQSSTEFQSQPFGRAPAARVPSPFMEYRSQTMRGPRAETLGNALVAREMTVLVTGRASFAIRCADGRGALRRIVRRDDRAYSCGERQLLSFPLNTRDGGLL